MAGTKVQELTEEQVAIITALMQREGELSEEEARLAVALMVRGGRSPRINPIIFRGVCWDGRFVPMPLAELLILDQLPRSPEDLKETRVLLTFRNDAYFRGWHHPGGYLGVNENFDDLLQRVAQKEIGVPVQKIGFAGVIGNRGLKRDHEVANVYVCSVDPETVDREDAAFFPVYELPPDILGHHRVIHQKGLDWLKYLLELPTEFQDRFRELSVVTDCLLPN